MQQYIQNPLPQKKTTPPLWPAAAIAVVSLGCGLVSSFTPYSFFTFICVAITTLALVALGVIYWRRLPPSIPATDGYLYSRSFLSAPSGHIRPPFLRAFCITLGALLISFSLWILPGGAHVLPVSSGYSFTAAPYNPACRYCFQQGHPTIDLNTIRLILSTPPTPNSKASSMLPDAQYIFDQGNGFQIDPAIALAFFKEESNLGIPAPGNAGAINKNPGNIRCTGTITPQTCSYDDFEKYATWQAGIHAWYWLISTVYLLQGRNDVSKAGPLYSRNSPGYSAAIEQNTDYYRSLMHYL